MLCRHYKHHIETHAPEEEHESLYEGPEVVVLVDGGILVFFYSNIPKQLSNPTHC